MSIERTGELRGIVVRRRFHGDTDTSTAQADLVPGVTV